MWQNWLNLILGLWVVVSAYVGFTASALAINLTITGLVIAALAAWSALSEQTEEQYPRTT